MRIAFYSDTYLPAIDGVVTSMLNAKKGLEARGHEVFIFAACKPGEKKKYSDRHTFLFTGFKFRPYPQYSVAAFPYHSMIHLKSLKVDIIHVQTPFVMGFNGMLAAKLGRYPLVGSFHTLYNSKSLSVYYPRFLRNLSQKGVWRYIKFFFRRCNTTVAPTGVIANQLRKARIPNVVTVPNSVDLSVFNPKVSGDAVRKQLNVKSREKLVLYLGRVSKEKRIEVFIKAAHVIVKKRSDVKFLIGGTGPMLKHYEDYAKRLGMSYSMHFMGFVDPKVLPNVYAACDVLCIPSTFETQGVVSLEAMACGKPVVGANAVALKELIKNRFNGEKFKADSYSDCAKKIEKVLNDCQSYRKGALKTAQDFSIEKVTDKLIEVYKSTIANDGT